MDRGDVIRIVLVLHVLGAIAGLGTNLTYGLIMSVGDRAGGAQRVFAIETIRKLDRRLANPAYMAQLATGLLLVWLLKLDLFGTSWLLLGLLLYVVVAVLGITVFAPLSRERGALAEQLAGGDETVAAEYGAVARRANRSGVIVTAIVVAIVVLMVAKPTLW